MLRKHLQRVFCILLLLILAGFPAPFVFGADSDPSALEISLNAKNETLTNVLEKISQISGYEIEFDQEWGNHPVNTQFENESLEDALSRVLVNLNHALIWNDNEKKISIFINGETGARRSKLSPSVSGSSSVSRGIEVQRRPIAESSDRVPSRSSDGVRDSSAPTSVRKSREQVPQPEGDLPVSLSGNKTRFEQGTSTID
jgi:type II secretory pathway component GspD/PulD (secretin)